MSGEFPLSKKQRNSLHHSFTQEDGEILAVNGPPGTGKTTLLRSIVANMWTQAALNKQEPPLIVATSNNNQAVTNILESFSSIDEKELDDSLIGRWLPEVDSYGLYFCAGGKANEGNLYRYSGPKGNGCMDEWQTQKFIANAHSHYLQKVSTWKGQTVSAIDEAITLIHSEMLSVENTIKYGIECFQKKTSEYWSITESYGSIEKLETKIDELKDNISENEKSLDYKKTILTELYKLWGGRSLFTSLLMWIPLVKKREDAKTSKLLITYDYPIEINSDVELMVHFQKSIKDIADELDILITTLKLATISLESYQLLERHLNSWLENNGGINLKSKKIGDKVVELNDRYHRFHLFKLATHYYEGRWIKETTSFVQSNDKDKKSPIKLLRKLRRYAKLTPCFVSTFYMLPNVFMAGEYSDQAWTDLPQLEGIDLLIVDEAGQALSDISSVSFALAKKALIVGDTDQIEPVWSISSSVDRSNLNLFGLLNNDNDYEQWLSSGLLASSGNVMRIAQRQSRHHQIDNLQRGLYLTEHRRCLDGIIEYCNELVYQGALEPSRGGVIQSSPWGMMSLVPVFHQSSTSGGSRCNEGEASSIAEWVRSQFYNVINYARAQDNKYKKDSDIEVIFQTIGIVTPFRKQANLIKSELVKIGLEGITVGTVHSLQGDERLIVLFSSVYGADDIDTVKFYDASHNMLNVAVSRAKDSFIVFGNPNVFGVASNNSPSGILRKRLTLADHQTKEQELIYH